MFTPAPAPPLASHVCAFIAAYARARGVAVAFDPFTRDGALVAEVVRLAGVARALAIVPGEPEVILDEPHGPGTVTWLVGDLDDHPEAAAGCGMIVTQAPALSPAAMGLVEATGVTLTERADEAFSPLERALPRLGPGGDVVVVARSGSWRLLRGGLGRAGFPLRAVLAVDDVNIGPGDEAQRAPAASGVEVLIFGGDRRGGIFTARLMPRTPPEELVDDLLAGRTGAIPELGLVVPDRAFFGWRHAELAADLAIRAREAGLTPVDLQAVASIEDHSTDASGGEAEGEGASEVLYWPRDLAARVTTEQPEEGGTGEACRLRFHPGALEIGYLERLLETPLGLRLRELVVLRANAFRNQAEAWPNALREATLYLPPLATQRAVLAAHLAARELVTRVEALDATLWEAPGASVEKLSVVLSSLPRSDQDFDQWMDSLPYPLASVLELYCAETEPKARCDHLLAFFECAAAFFSTVALSGLRSGDVPPGTPYIELPAQTRPSSAATFGDWLWRLQVVQGAMRSGAKHAEGRDELRRAFRTDSGAFLTLLGEPTLFSTLDAARALRNRVAHGRRTLSVEQARSRLLELEVLLDRFRRVVSDAFAGLELLAPRASQDHERYHEATVVRLMGRHPRLIDGIRTTHSLSVRRLYLHDRRSRKALPLLPLIRHQPGSVPGEETCYFFDRVATSGAWFVSHHATIDAEVLVEDDGVLDTALRRLHWHLPPAT